MVEINGKAYAVGGLSIAQMLVERQLDENLIVIEVNQKIVSKEDYNRYRLQDNDVVEIVRFVGGG